MDTSPEKVDFYAAAATTSAVILFAKFSSHRANKNRDAWYWVVLHLLCVVGASTAFALSLLVLGWSVTSQEAWIRQLVAGALLGAGLIFALDVAWPSETSPLRIQSARDKWRSRRTR